LEQTFLFLYHKDGSSTVLEVLSTFFLIKRIYLKWETIKESISEQEFLEMLNSSNSITLIKERSRKDSTIMREKNRVLDLPTE